jgi:hypothetical protein
MCSELIGIFFFDAMRSRRVVCGVFIFDEFVLKMVSSGEENGAGTFAGVAGSAYKTLV